MSEININLLGIATKAARLGGRVTKEKALFALARVAQGDPTADDLALLYKFFTPPPPHKAGNDFAWVSRAAADKSEARDYMRGVYSTGGLLLASNGHIAFSVPTDLPTGVYHKSGLRETPLADALRPVEDGEITRFPAESLRRFGEMHADLQETRRSLCDFALVPHPVELARLCYLVPYGGATYYINKRYLDLAVDGSGVFSYNVHPDAKRMQIKKGSRVAYVMAIED